MQTYRVALFLLASLFVSMRAISAQPTAIDNHDLGPAMALQPSASDIVHSSSSMQANATAVAAPSYVFVFGSGGGLARLNLTNGGIQFCVLTLTNGRPTSSCVKIGSFPTDNLASAQMTFVPGHIVVTNAITGVMVDCAVALNSTFGGFVPSGTCITLTPGS